MSQEITHTTRAAFENRHTGKNCQGNKKKILLSLKIFTLVETIEPLFTAQVV